MTALLVTGSRSLAETPAAEQWAREQLRLALAEVTELWHGACQKSPDVWAEEVLLELAGKGAVRRVMVRSFRQDGEGWDREYTAEWFSGVPWTWALPSWVKGWGRRAPLERNAFMVHQFKRHASSYYRVPHSVLALRCPWARTHGTEMTAGLARRAGLQVTERLCPRELGPGGGR